MKPRHNDSDHRGPGTPDGEDLPLRRLLQAWQVDAALPPGFIPSVWRRIESSDRRAVAEAAPWAALWRWLGRALVQPRVAVAYLAILCVVGAGAGAIRGQARWDSAADGLHGQYVRSIDPFFAGVSR